MRARGLNHGWVESQDSGGLTPHGNHDLRQPRSLLHDKQPRRLAVQMTERRYYSKVSLWPTSRNASLWTCCSIQVHEGAPSHARPGKAGCGRVPSRGLAGGLQGDAGGIRPESKERVRPPVFWLFFRLQKQFWPPALRCRGGLEFSSTMSFPDSRTPSKLPKSP